MAELTTFRLAPLASVRFDDAAITMIRPWRRQRIEWPYITGLIYGPGPGRDDGRRSTLTLRLVLAGNEPPVDRYLSPVQLARYARGPAVMTVRNAGNFDMHTISGRPVERVLEQLADHGLPRPEPKLLAFRLPQYNPDQVRFAIAVDMIGLGAATVNHGVLTDETADLVTEVVPALARTHGADLDQTSSGKTYVTYVFQKPGAQRSADAFLAAVEAAVPADWIVTPTALPSGPGIEPSQGVNTTSG